MVSIREKPPSERRRRARVRVKKRELTLIGFVVGGGRLEKSGKYEEGRPEGRPSTFHWLA
jgi:hypothetical protein